MLDKTDLITYIINTALMLTSGWKRWV